MPEPVLGTSGEPSHDKPVHGRPLLTFGAAPANSVVQRNRVLATGSFREAHRHKTNLDGFSSDNCSVKQQTGNQAKMPTPQKWGPVVFRKAIEQGQNR